MSSRQPPPSRRPAAAEAIVGTLAAVSTLLAARRRTGRRLPATVVATILWIIWGVMEWLRRRRNNKLEDDTEARERPEREEIRQGSSEVLEGPGPAASSVPVLASSSAASVGFGGKGG